MKKGQKHFDSAVLRTDESKATENSRHFVMNNGTKRAFFFPHKMNHFDEEKKAWAPIDNSLKSKGDGYVASLGKYTAKFLKEGENEAVELSGGTDKISWEYLGINKNVFSNLRSSAVKPGVKSKSILKVRNDVKDPTSLTPEGHAVYANAEGGIDIDYSVEGNGIKENIIIREKSLTYHYFFLLRVTGFEMKAAPDGKEIKFYKSGTRSDDLSNNIPEFIMPAPFMYDANGNQSNQVKYTVEKIEDEVYLFSVDASSEWINADERVFPVCIDPQLLSADGSTYISVTHDQYQWCDCTCSSCSCNESYWMHTYSPVYNHIYLQKSNSYKTTAKLHINKSGIDLTRNRVISAKLLFQKYTGENYSTSAYIRIGNNNYYHYNSSTLTADITTLYNSFSGDFDVDLSMVTADRTRRFYVPTLQIEYQPINDDPVRKTLSVETGVQAEFDVLSGNATAVFDDISDPVLGVAVSHVYKPNDEITEYGRNFRLNLDEKLVKTSTTSTGNQYAYTDAQGDVHTFKEHFYRIGTNGEKVYITSGVSSITADADGRLWLNSSEVFRELTTDKGLRASARLEGVVNNAEWVEQRLDEEKQAEEQVKSYKNTLCNFVSVNRQTGNISAKMNENKLASPDSVESFLSEIGCASHLLLSKEEALAYKSLKTQRESLEKSRAALQLQQRSLTDSAKSLLLQYNAPSTYAYQKKNNRVQSSALEIESSSINENDSLHDEKTRLIGTKDTPGDTRYGLLLDSNNLINSQENQWKTQINHIEDQIRNFPGLTNVPDDGPDGTLTCQYYNVGQQIDVITNKQLPDLTAQINLYAEKSSLYISQFKAYYKEYLNLKNQQEKLKMQVPVAYLISDSVVKGFNTAGNLVIMQDKYGKYIVVEREKYNTVGKTRVSSVYDRDGKTMRFSYNGNNKLSEICHSLGERVAFRYDTSGYLIAIERENQPVLSLTYTTAAGVKRISGIASSIKTSATLSYNLSGMLTKITRNSTVSRIEHDNATAGDPVTLSVLNIAYTSTETKLTYDGIRQEIYLVDQNAEQVNAHLELVNGVVTSAERYTYTDYLLTKTEYADKSCLNRYSYAQFAAHLQIKTVEETTYNTFKEPVLVERSTFAVPRTDCDCPTERTTVEYTYNDDRKLTEKKTTHCYLDCCEAFDTTVSVEKYYYDHAGEIVRTETYTEGEELKTGVNVEEHVYNDQGVEIRSFTYNSLEPSSRFYTEREADETGKILASFDESGEHKTAFDYERDGVTVKTERLPNGSKFSRGGTKDGSVTAITHSTEAGEENSTNQARTLDAVTEVKSGNNKVRYVYDEKRRVRSVSLNDVDNYVTYTYRGENTNAETVEAELAGETTTTVTKDAHGNVTVSSCEDRSVTNTYNADQQLIRTADSVSGQTSLSYDEKGNVTAVTAPDHTEAFAYDEHGEVLESKTVTVGNDSLTYEYGYKPTADKRLESIAVDGNTVKPQTDALGRNTGKVIEFGNNKIAEKISYVKFGDHATNLPASVRFAIKGVFRESMQYKYDSMGNIVEISENGRMIYRYEYDALGRLTREDNVPFGNTFTLAYDNNGNILAKYKYPLTAKPTDELPLLDADCALYTYADNSDRLVSYNGETFDYDLIGNPTTYREKTATWAYGRQLVSYDGNTFAYDARGRRTAKNNNNITFIYDSNGNLIKQSNGLEFLYDHTGVFATKYNNATYYYRKDAQGNIIALLDNTGMVVVEYKYDAWGKCLTSVLDPNASTIAELNPFRYRGYYYDTETNLYYLQTRYYDPEVGRFITIDDLSYLDPETINGLNLYAYCCNNPVMGYDPNGTWEWDWGAFWRTAAVVAAAIVIVAVVAAVTVATGGSALVVLAGAGIGAFVSGSISVVTQYVNTGTVNWFSVAVDAAIGAVTGAFGGSAIGQMGMAISGAAVGFAGSVAKDWVEGESINWANAALSGVMSGLLAYAGGAGAQHGLTGERQAALAAKQQIIAKNRAGEYRHITNYNMARASNGARIQRATDILNKAALRNIFNSTRATFEYSVYMAMFM